jgi:(p)ppGpp synthase/HD superfamily hydrolase
MVLTPRLRDAFLLVFELDANNPRKGTEIPYLAHLLSVCSLVLYDGGDEDQACAALLHDTLEDHPDSVTYQLLETRFGKSVADIVAALSDTPKGYRGGEKPKWRTRKEEYLEHLKKAPPEVLRISAADKLDNARAIQSDYRKVGEEVWKRFKAGREEQTWYYRELVKTYRTAGF